MTRLAMIVEDDAELSELFADVLNEAGLETAVVNDGAAALEAIHRRFPDVVVLDMHLPNVSGIEILAQIRGDAHLQHIKVVVVTADAELANASEALADIVMLKPVGYNQLTSIALRLVNPNGS